MDENVNFSLIDLLNAARRTWEEEQKEILFERGNRSEIKEYFDFMKFFFGSKNVV